MIKRGIRALSRSILALLIVLPLVAANPVETFRGLSSKIIQFGNLDFLGLSDQTVILSLMRILIWLLTFTLFFAVTSNEHIIKIFNRKYATVISLVLATIVALFFADNLLLLVGGGAAAIVAFILIGGPVVAVGYLLWKIPGHDHEEHAGHVFLKLCLCVFLLWILGAIKFHLLQLGG